MIARGIEQSGKYIVIRGQSVVIRGHWVIC